MSSASQYIGSRVSLTTKSQIRYEGILFSLDHTECTVSMEQVKCMGTEGRNNGTREISPSSTVYEMIVFRASDIIDLKINTTPYVNDSAIISSTTPPQQSKTCGVATDHTNPKPNSNAASYTTLKDVSSSLQPTSNSLSSSAKLLHSETANINSNGSTNSTNKPSHNNFGLDKKETQSTMTSDANLKSNTIKKSTIRNSRNFNLQSTQDPEKYPVQYPKKHLPFDAKETMKKLSFDAKETDTHLSSGSLTSLIIDPAPTQITAELRPARTYEPVIGKHDKKAYPSVNAPNDPLPTERRKFTLQHRTKKESRFREEFDLDRANRRFEKLVETEGLSTNVDEKPSYNFNVSFFDNFASGSQELTNTGKKGFKNVQRKNVETFGPMAYSSKSSSSYKGNSFHSRKGNHQDKSEKSLSSIINGQR